MERNMHKTEAGCSERPVHDRVMDQAMTQSSSVAQSKASSPKVSAPVRAVFVIQKLAGLSGGAERVFIETAEAMAARGCCVRFISLDSDPSGPLAFGQGRVPVTSVMPAWLQCRAARRAKTALSRSGHPAGRSKMERMGKAIPNIFPLTHLKWHLTHGMFERALAKDLRRAPADVIVAFLPPAITSAARAGARLGIPVIASTHNVPDLDFGDSDRWDQNPIYRARARDALSLVARVTILQSKFQKWFGADVLAKVTVLPNPVSRLCSLAESPPERGAVILGVGRLTRIKRWDLLIQAFASVSTQLPDWSLRIFGSGPERGPLEARISALKLEDRIAILPPKPGIGEEYDRASILVHPSEFEGFGLSVAEAMAHGLPVIAFADCDGVNDLLEDNHSGLLLERSHEDQENVRNLGQALLHLAQNADLRTRLGSQATAITKRFDRAAIHDIWAQLLHEVAASKGDPRHELE
jgi:glycosyltransferase involved in cell wall biosynthesis